MDRREADVARQYSDHASMKSDRCYYCGFFADTADHWPALSVSDLLPGDRGLRIRSCQGCNSDLGTTHQATLEERKEVITSLRRRRYFEGKEKQRFNSKSEKALYKRWEYVLRQIARGEPVEPNNALLEELKRFK